VDTLAGEQSVGSRSKNVIKGHHAGKGKG